MSKHNRMKIVAIASMPLDLELACFGTLSRCIEDGHKAHIIIAKANENKTGWTQKKIETLRRVSEKIGVSQVYFTDRFDYSAVTQESANVLASFLKTIDPSLVIMPFWKASNQKRKILAKTSLVACRGIGSILMYDLEKNRNFLPTVYFVLSTDEILAKRSCLLEYGGQQAVLGAREKVNCFNLNLLTMKKYHASKSMYASTFSDGATIPHNYYQQLVFASSVRPEFEKLGNIENDPNNKKATRVDTKHNLYSQRADVNVLVEVFESHRMLLVDREDGF